MENVKIEDTIKISYPLAIKEISKLFAELFTRNAQFQDRPDLHARTNDERILNRIYGNVAVLSVAYWLSQNGKFVRIYDLERNEFNAPDEWDLLVKNKNNKLMKVEIKSSGPAQNTENMDVCLKNRRIAIKPGEQKDINIQVYFFPNDCEKYAYIISWVEKKILDSMEVNNEIESYGGGEARRVFIRKLNEYLPLNKLLESLI